jgi:peptidoglycan-associated lipoprotein
MARTVLMVGAAATLGLGVADLSYLNLRLVPEVISQRAPPPEPAPEPSPRSPLEPTPSANQPRSVAFEAPAAAAESEPVAVGPEPVTAEPEPVIEPPEPVIEPPEPVAAEPEPVIEPPEPAPMPAPTVLHFASNSDSLPDGAHDALDGIVDLLSEHDGLRVYIDGHADERGSRAYNESLSKRRADQVADYLEARGVPLDRMSRQAFGESRPVVEGRDPAALAQNRRVEVVVKRGQP